MIWWEEKNVYCFYLTERTRGNAGELLWLQRIERIINPIVYDVKIEMVKALDCGIKVHEFKIQSHYYVDLRTNTFGKSMNPLILPSTS